MVIDELLQIDDKVVVAVHSENREWGYNPAPDGTKATVIGFSEIHYGRTGNFGFKAGVYESRGGVRLRLENGSELSLSSHHLNFDDQDEYSRRLAQFREAQQADPNHWHTLREQAYLRELPETPFWEGDIVRAKAHSRLIVVTGEMPPAKYPNTFMIVGIEYYNLDQLTLAGTPYPAYQISSDMGAGWHTAASADDMELVERGNVWKYYHEEPLTFADIREEANFFERLGLVDDVRNPANGLYKWTQEEVLEAIQQGLVHGISLSSGLFGTKPSVQARRFRNEELGQRVAKATLEGFGIVPA